MRLSFFFFNDTATTEIYTLSLHDALPIYTPTICNVVELFDLRPRTAGYTDQRIQACYPKLPPMVGYASTATRSEEHTSELQSQSNLVCRLLLEKKNTTAYSLSRHGPSTSD